MFLCVIFAITIPLTIYSLISLDYNIGVFIIIGCADMILGGAIIQYYLRRTFYRITIEGLLIIQGNKAKIIKFEDIVSVQIHDDVINIPMGRSRSNLFYRGMKVNFAPTTRATYTVNGLYESQNYLKFIEKYKYLPVPMDKEFMMALQHNGIKILITPIVDTKYRRELIKKGHKPDPITGEVFFYE